ncbi:MAG: PilZ domain-containing protein [Desulfuromonadales bacterium]|nr:MAG: PilZ domain-containing protein [Desulfuromonadales bacterium]
MESSDRRKHPRVPFKAPAFLEHNAKVVYGEVRDISLHGMYMNVRGEYTAEEEADISLYFLRGPVTLSVTVPGRIARIGEDGIGFKSSHIDPLMLLSLESLLTFDSQDSPGILEDFIATVSSHSAGGTFLDS